MLKHRIMEETSVATPVPGRLARPAILHDWIHRRWRLRRKRWQLSVSLFESQPAKRPIAVDRFSACTHTNILLAWSVGSNMSHNMSSWHKRQLNLLWGELAQMGEPYNKAVISEGKSSDIQWNQWWSHGYGSPTTGFRLCRGPAVSLSELSRLTSKIRLCPRPCSSVDGSNQVHNAWDL